MKSTRAQLSLFIIIGILLLFTATILIFFLEKERTEIQDVTLPEVQAVKEFVTRCLEEELQETVRLVALQGGYYGIPDDSVEISLQGLSSTVYFPYYLTEIPNMPTKENVEEAIERGLGDSISTCLDFTIFKNLEIDLQRNPTFKVSLSNDEVSVLATVPLLIREPGSGAKEVSLRKFTAQTKAHLGTLLTAASKITQQQEALENKQCLTCLSALGNLYDVNIETMEVEKEDRTILLYLLKPQGEDIVYNFAHAFPIQEELIPTLLTIENLQAEVGKEFRYDLNIQGDDLAFSDDSDLFEISTEGVIEFLPLPEDKGSHIITVHVEDQKGEFDEETFILEVVDNEPEKFTATDLS